MLTNNVLLMLQVISTTWLLSLSIRRYAYPHLEPRITMSSLAAHVGVIAIYRHLRHMSAFAANVWVQGFCWQLQHMLALAVLHRHLRLFRQDVSVCLPMSVFADHVAVSAMCQLNAGLCRLLQWVYVGVCGTCRHLWHMSAFSVCPCLRYMLAFAVYVGVCAISAFAVYVCFCGICRGVRFIWAFLCCFVGWMLVLDCMSGRLRHMSAFSAHVSVCGTCPC